MIKAALSPPRWCLLSDSRPLTVASFLPGEWRTAAASLRAMNLAAGPLGHSYPRSLVAFLLPFVFGAAPGWFAASVLAGADATVAVGVMAALLAFGGLLLGFVVTLMLFTGRLADPSRLTYEQAEAFATRLKYLLASQAMTLFAALLLAVVALVWMVLYAARLPVISMAIVGAVLGGFTGVCVVRMFLLPMQIYELHEESLDAAVAQKLDENQKRFSHS